MDIPQSLIIISVLYCLSFETYHIGYCAHCFHALFLKDVSVDVQRSACLRVTKAGGDRSRIDTAGDEQGRIEIVLRRFAPMDRTKQLKSQTKLRIKL